MSRTDRQRAYISPFDADNGPAYIEPGAEAARLSKQVDADQQLRDRAEQKARRRAARALKRQNAAKNQRSASAQSKPPTGTVRTASRNGQTMPRRDAAGPTPERSAQPSQSSHPDGWQTDSTSSETQSKTQDRPFSFLALLAIVLAALAYSKSDDFFGLEETAALAWPAIALAIVAFARTFTKRRRRGRIMAPIAVVIAVAALVTAISSQPASFPITGQDTYYAANDAAGDERNGSHESNAAGDDDHEAQAVSERVGTVSSYGGKSLDITIAGASLGERDSLTGERTVIITLTVTNTGSRTSINSLGELAVFQNGLALDHTYLYPEYGDTVPQGYDRNALSRDVAAGATVTAMDVFQLREDATPLVVRFDSYRKAGVVSAFTFDGIPADASAGASLTQVDSSSLPTAPQTGDTSREGMTTFTGGYPARPIGSARVDSIKAGPADYEGNDTVIVTLTWVNDSDKPVRLPDLGALQAKQGKTELEIAYLDEGTEGYDEQSRNRLVLPGVETRATLAYVLKKKGPVEFTLTGYDDDANATLKARME